METKIECRKSMHLFNNHKFDQEKKNIDAVMSYL